MDVALPVGRNCPRWSRHRLLRGVTVRGRQLGAVEHITRSEVVKPILPGLEALDDRVPSGRVMGGCVLAGRSVATADMPAGGAATQMHPPALRSEALHAAGSTRWNRRVDLARR
jgi:hypothetical protein